MYPGGSGYSNVPKKLSRETSGSSFDPDGLGNLVVGFRVVSGPAGAISGPRRGRGRGLDN